MDNQTQRSGIRGWLSRHKPTKRRLIQVYAALLYNANLKGFSTGKIYTGDSKKFCLPGLNCYSCPGAVGACPLGSLQNALASSSTSSVAYVFGILILLGLLLGRAICGFLCPFGLIQELLHKIPSPKLKKNKVTKVFSYFKYVILGIFVVMIPLAFSTKLPVPGFCKYICPDGTLIGAIALLVNPSNADMFSMLGPLFTWKFCLLVAFLVSSVFIYRFFCRFFCPLGAIYGFFCKVAMLGVKLDKEKCISCGKCVEQCQMDIRHVGDHECIHCGKCIPVCPTKAIRWSGSKFFLAESEIKKDATEEEIAQVKAHNKKVEKRRKVCQIVGAVLAIALLVGAFWYFWPESQTPNVGDTTPSGSETSPSEPEPTEPVIVETPTPDTAFNLRIDKDGTAYYFNGQISSDDSLGELGTTDDISEAVEIFVEQTEGGYKLYFIQDSLTRSTQETYICVYEDGDEVKICIDRNSQHYVETGTVFNWDRENMTFTAEVEGEEYFIGATESDSFGATPVSKMTDDNVSHLYTVVSEPSGDGPTPPDDKKYGYEVGNYCPEFTLSLIGSDETISLSQFEGKVVVVNFWANWCTPCKNELPEFDRLAVDYADDVAIIAISTDSLKLNSSTPDSYIQEQMNACQNFIEENDLTNIYAAFDSAAALSGSSAYATIGHSRNDLPITLVLDRDGKIIFFTTGGLTYEKLLGAIAPAL